MNLLQVIWCHHIFFRRRTLLLTSAVALAFCLFGILGALRYSMHGDVRSAAANRLMVMSESGTQQSLPLSVLETLRGVQGVDAVSYATWQGLYYREQSNMFMSFAVDPETWLATHPDMEMQSDVRRRFLDDRRAILVSEELADKFSWKQGDSIPVKSLLFVPPDGEGAWNYVVAGVFTPKTDSGGRNYAVTHYDYLNENRQLWKNTVGTFVVSLDPGASVDDVASRIDTMFESTVWPTYTRSDLMFHREFFAQFGDVITMIEMVVGVSFVSLMLMVGSGMALATRQRRRDLGVMRVLGFSSARIVALVAGQTLVLIAIGASLGMLIAYVFNVTVTSIYPEVLPHVYLPVPVILQGLAIGLALGVAASSIPAMIALRTRPIEALREDAV